MTKILWVSKQYEPLQSQLTELRRLYGADVEVSICHMDVFSAAAVVRRFRKSGADELIILAPTLVIAGILGLGIRPLLSDLRPAEDGEPHDLEVKGRKMCFHRFKRAIKMEIVKEEL